MGACRMIMADTSERAFNSLTKEDRQRLRDLILTQIQFSVHGRTCDEIENLCGLTHQTCSARVTELLKDKKIHYTDETRKTRSGRAARVYYWGYKDQSPQTELFR
jgi:hypothetical protein